MSFFFFSAVFFYFILAIIYLASLYESFWHKEDNYHTGDAVSFFVFLFILGCWVYRFIFGNVFAVSLPLSLFWS